MFFKSKLIGFVIKAFGTLSQFYLPRKQVEEPCEEIFPPKLYFDIMEEKLML